MNVLSRATIEGATAGAVIGTILLTGGQLQTPDRASAQTQRESVAEVVKAKRFEVIDADGKVGARLEGNTLTLMGSGESLVELNPFLGLELSDRFGAANLSARSLAMKDKKGLPGQWWEIRMKVAHDHIELTDRDGKTRAILGASQLRITQTEEVRQRPESSLVFFNSEGRVIWSAP